MSKPWVAGFLGGGAGVGAGVGAGGSASSSASHSPALWAAEMRSAACRYAADDSSPYRAARRSSMTSLVQSILRTTLPGAFFSRSFGLSLNA